MSSPYSEIRGSQRRSVSWRSRIYTVGKQFLEAKVTDISTGGCGFVCDSALRNGTELNMSITVQEVRDRMQVHMIHVRGIVRWSIMGGAGVKHGFQFVEIDDFATELILDWVRAQ